MLRFALAPFQTLRCMSFHRNLKMVHVNGGDHLVTCSTCKEKKRQDTKNTLLTWLYFNRRWYTLPFMIPIVICGVVHYALTRREGSFEHPPEHLRERFA